MATNMPISLRSDKTEAQYLADKAVGLLTSLKQKTPLVTFAYWLIIVNDYPYDVAFKTHHLLIPRREVASRFDLTSAELADLSIIIREYIEPNYDTMMDNTARTRSILQHYHIHLMVYHNKREDMSL